MSYESNAGWYIQNRQRRNEDRNDLRAAYPEIFRARESKHRCKTRLKQRAYQKKSRSRPGFRKYNRLKMQEWRAKNRARWNEISRLSYHRRKHEI